MIIISIISFCSSLILVYLFLRKNILAYKQQRQHNILEQIQREVVETDRLQKIMLEKHEKLRKTQHQEELIGQQIEAIKKNNLQIMLNRKKNLEERYKDIYLKKCEEMRADVIRRIILDILKHADKEDYELIANIKATLAEISQF